MIVFGHNNFLLKQISPADIGMAETEETKGITFEVRQHYFHLFWIPFFSIGKIYVFKRAGSGDDLFQMPEQVKLVIQHKYPDIKTPWYTFALPILGLVIFLGYLANEKISDQQDESRFYNRVAEKKGYIQYPTTGDYYKLVLSDKEGSYDSRSDLYLKVEKYDDKDIHVVSLYPSLSQKSDYMSMSTAMEAFDTVARFSYNAMPIPKTLLLNAIDSTYRGYGNEPRIFYDALGRYVEIAEMERRELD